jgi:hypothetical protein
MKFSGEYFEISPNISYKFVIEKIGSDRIKDTMNVTVEFRNFISQLQRVSNVQKFSEMPGLFAH